jgi:hypothetical protein
MAAFPNLSEPLAPIVDRFYDDLEILEGLGIKGAAFVSLLERYHMELAEEPSHLLGRRSYLRCRASWRWASLTGFPE